MGLERIERASTFFEQASAHLVGGVLQRVAACCSVLKRVAHLLNGQALIVGGALQCVAACCSVLQCVAVCCSVLLVF